MKPFLYLQPKTIKEAIKAVHLDPQAQYIAGGTNLTDLMKRGIESPTKLVDINRLPLNKIDQKLEYIRIGALVLNSELIQNKLLIEKHPLLTQSLQAGASGQLRNMATVGGNLLQKTRCDYFYDSAFPCNKRKPGSGCAALNGINRLHAIFGVSDTTNENDCIAVHPSDMAVALIALDAKVVLMDANGERKLPLSDIYRAMGNGPDKEYNFKREDLIVAVEIPENPFFRNSHYLKVRDRASFAFAVISVAAALHIENNQIRSARLVMGGVAYKPWRNLEVEKILVGQPVSEVLFQRAAALFMKDAYAFEHNKFKLKLAAKSIVHALTLATSLT